MSSLARLCDISPDFYHKPEVVSMAMLAEAIVELADRVDRIARDLELEREARQEADQRGQDGLTSHAYIASHGL